MLNIHEFCVGVCECVGECMFFLKFYLKLKTCTLVPDRNVALVLRKIGRIISPETKVKYIYSASTSSEFHPLWTGNVKIWKNKFCEACYAFWVIPELVLFISIYLHLGRTRWPFWECVYNHMMNILSSHMDAAVPHIAQPGANSSVKEAIPKAVFGAPLSQE